MATLDEIRRTLASAAEAEDIAEGAPPEDRADHTLPPFVSSLKDVHAIVNAVDDDKRFKIVNGGVDATLIFSKKHRGKTVSDVARSDPGYLDWMHEEMDLPGWFTAVCRTWLPAGHVFPARAAPKEDPRRSKVRSAMGRKVVPSP